MLVNFKRKTCLPTYKLRIKQMRKIAANYIFPISSKPLKNGIVEVDDSGKIINIIDTKGDLRESAKLEFYNGILVPGFVNAHSHTELSRLREKIEEKGNKITIGTGSSSSNDQQSVLYELITIQNHFPDISLEMLFKWATLNGAEALGFDKDLGSFEIGKTPGVNLISGIDFQNMQFTEKSEVKSLV